jgi:homoserine dehydrogenase
MILRLAIIGFGNVGQEFARLILAKRDWLVKQKGLDIEVLAISTRSRGSLLSKRAIDLQRALDELADKGHLRGYGPEVTDKGPLEIIDNCDADLMIELTTLNAENGQPATDHILNALQAGMDVVTANKGPIAYSYDKLRSVARSRNVHLRFEGTVMDGTPIFSMVERTLPGCQVTGIRGILNSTSNFVLTEMSKGMSMEFAIKEAQTRGFAEADPSMDIDGWDAAVKITALANVLMAAKATPMQVRREGIGSVTSKDLEDAAAQGKKLKLVASAEKDGDSVSLRVAKEFIDPNGPFWSVEGTSSAITIKTDMMGDLSIIETDPTVTQTAYAVFSDILLVVEAIRAGTL